MSSFYLVIVLHFRRLEAAGIARRTPSPSEKGW